MISTPKLDQMTDCQFNVSSINREVIGMGDQKQHIYCNKCKERTVFKAVFADNRDYQQSHAPAPSDPQKAIMFVWVCTKCNLDYVFDFRVGNQQEFHPARQSILPKEFPNLPQDLKGIYHEVVKSFIHGCYILCSIGIRACIEGIYIDKKGSESRDERNMPTKLEWLCSEGHISEHQKEILLAIKDLGNDSAHELHKPNQEDIEIFIDVIENMFKNIYEYPVMRKQIDQQREERERKKD